MQNKMILKVEPIPLSPTTLKGAPAGGGAVPPPLPKGPTRGPRLSAPRPQRAL